MSDRPHARALSLVRLILRQERIALSLWIGTVVLFASATAAGFAKLYPTEQALRLIAAQMANNPAVTAILGPVQMPTLGGLVAWRWTIQGEFILAMMSIFTVIRHTRGEEDDGRRELIASTSIGRHAPLTAAIIATLGANLVASLLVTGVLIQNGLALTGALALAISVAGFGCVATGVGAVCAQLYDNASSARRVAGGTMMILYLLRVIGDTAGLRSDRWNLLSWLSPAGWTHRVRPFANERWWVLLLFIAATALLVTLTYRLAERRDVGAGFLHTDSSRANAPDKVRSVFALSWRVHRALLVLWTGSFAMMGLVFGFVADSASAAVVDNPQMRAIFARMGATNNAAAVIFHFCVLTFSPAVALYAMQAVLRMGAEESALRLDPVLSTPVSRASWAASHLVFAIGVPPVILLALATTTGASYAWTVGRVTSDVKTLFGATLVYLPAIWICVGIAMVQYGWLPRLKTLPWALWTAFMMWDLFAPELRSATGITWSASPFAHVPNVLLGTQWSVGTTALQTVLAAVLIAVGVLGFRRRDIG